MKLLLVGATGLVGRQVLDLALADPRVDAVVAPGRRARPPRAKLAAPVIDFEQLDRDGDADADWWQADAVICTRGACAAEGRPRVGIRKGRKQGAGSGR